MCFNHSREFKYSIQQISRHFFVILQILIWTSKNCPAKLSPPSEIVAKTENNSKSKVQKVKFKKQSSKIKVQKARAKSQMFYGVLKICFKRLLHYFHYECIERPKTLIFEF
jgi:hypothetical protein